MTTGVNGKKRKALLRFKTTRAHCQKAGGEKRDFKHELTIERRRSSYLSNDAGEKQQVCKYCFPISYTTRVCLVQQLKHFRQRPWRVERYQMFGIECFWRTLSAVITIFYNNKIHTNTTLVWARICQEAQNVCHSLFSVHPQANTQGRFIRARKSRENYTTLEIYVSSTIPGHRSYNGVSTRTV